jgi:hypothetical protein
VLQASLRARRAHGERTVVGSKRSVRQVGEAWYQAERTGWRDDYARTPPACRSERDVPAVRCAARSRRRPRRDRRGRSAPWSALASRERLRRTRQRRLLPRPQSVPSGAVARWLVHREDALVELDRRDVVRGELTSSRNVGGHIRCRSGVETAGGRTMTGHALQTRTGF